VLWVIKLTQCLGLYEPLLILPLMVSTYILFGGIAGGIYFREFDTLHEGVGGYGRWGLYVGGMLLVLFGLYCISTAGIRMKEQARARWQSATKTLQLQLKSAGALANAGANRRAAAAESHTVSNRLTSARLSVSAQSEVQHPVMMIARSFERRSSMSLSRRASINVAISSELSRPPGAAGAEAPILPADVVEVLERAATAAEQVAAAAMAHAEALRGQACAARDRLMGAPSTDTSPALERTFSAMSESGTPDDDLDPHHPWSLLLLAWCSPSLVPDICLV
jgi:hypothetical protein